MLWSRHFAEQCFGKPPAVDFPTNLTSELFAGSSADSDFVTNLTTCLSTLWSDLIELVVAEPVAAEVKRECYLVGSVVLEVARLWGLQWGYSVWEGVEPMQLRVVGAAGDLTLKSTVGLAAVVESDSATIIAGIMLPALQGSQPRKVVGPVEELV